jgi:hypothetical protein
VTVDKPERNNEQLRQELASCAARTARHVRLLAHERVRGRAQNETIHAQGDIIEDLQNEVERLLAIVAELTGKDVESA